jgi:aerobic-type carbon monoxide dehydrogenase small subunit (CoxS/CutS family)
LGRPYSEREVIAMERRRTIRVTVNEAQYEREVDVRKTLADFLREDLGLRGTHLGCEHGVCGACTILFDDVSVRSCILYAVQADGADILTVEGLAPAGGPLHPIQEAFRDHHGLQCGFCTPGFLMPALELLVEKQNLSEDEIREAISGNLCRCTGYQGIVEAIHAADETWQRT